MSSQWLQWDSGFPGRFVSPVVCNCLVVSSISLLLYSGLPYLEGTWCVAILCVTIFVEYFLFESRRTSVLVWVFLGVCSGGPGGLQYGLYEVMHRVFNVPICFKENVECKVFVYIILKSHPIRCF